MSLPATKLSCNRCSAVNVETARFCNHCGNPLEGTVSAPRTPPAGARKTCPGCHKLNAAMAVFCAECGVRLPAQATVPQHGEPAGFWIRAGALLVDGFIGVVLISLVQARLGIVDPPEGLYGNARLEAALPGLLLSMTLNLLYDTLMIGTWGATVGKMICRIKVVRGTGGEAPTYGISLTRSLAHIVSLLPLGLGYLWVVFTPTKRAWHDYMCDTRVVHTRPR